MSPRLTFTLTLLGVLLAGVPLVALTGKRTAAPQETASAVVPQETCCMLAEMRFDGAPTSLRLLHLGHELAAMPAGTESPWVTEIALPPHTAELELQAEWPDATQHAVNITLTHGGESATDTQWSDPAATSLHTLFTLPW